MGKGAVRGAVAAVQLGSERAKLGSSHLLWDRYEVPVDAASWLYSVVGAVETMPVAVSIADMRVAGAPLIYVNQAWCDTTGHPQSAAIGSSYLEHSSTPPHWSGYSLHVLVHRGQMLLLSQSL